MKNKGKKTYLTFMTLFLAVTMFISSSITLAFFGSSTTGSTTVKMGNAVEVDSSIEVESTTLYVYPSEMVDVDATATVLSPGDANSTTDAILRAKITSTTNVANIAVVPKITIDGENAYWVKNSDGYFYLVTKENGNTLYTIKSTTTGKAVPMQISVIIPSNLSNADAGKKYTITAVFCAVQAKIYNSTGVSTITNTIDNTRPVFEDVENQ